MDARKEIVRFLIAGSAAGATDFGIYYLLIHFLPFSPAKGISFTCAGIVAYVLNKRWVFQYSLLSSSREVRRYWMINCVALGINILINQVILDARPGAVFVALGIASMSTGLFTFICFKWWVFSIAIDPRKL